MGSSEYDFSSSWIIRGRKSSMPRKIPWQNESDKDQLRLQARQSFGKAQISRGQRRS